MLSSAESTHCVPYIFYHPWINGVLSSFWKSHRYFRFFFALFHTIRLHCFMHFLSDSFLNDCLQYLITESVAFLYTIHMCNNRFCNQIRFIFTEFNNSYGAYMGSLRFIKPQSELKWILLFHTITPLLSSSGKACHILSHWHKYLQ